MFGLTSWLAVMDATVDAITTPFTDVTERWKKKLQRSQVGRKW